MSAPETYTKESVLETVTKIVVEQLGSQPDTVVPSAKYMEDLGADSLDMVELVMAFEEEFGIDISDEVADKCVDIKSTVDIIFDEVQEG